MSKRTSPTNTLQRKQFTLEDIEGNATHVQGQRNGPLPMMVDDRREQPRRPRGCNRCGLCRTTVVLPHADCKFTEVLINDSEVGAYWHTLLGLVPVSFMVVWFLIVAFTDQLYFNYTLAVGYLGNIVLYMIFTFVIRTWMFELGYYVFMVVGSFVVYYVPRDKGVPLEKIADFLYVAILIALCLVALLMNMFDLSKGYSVWSEHRRVRRSAGQIYVQ